MSFYNAYYCDMPALALTSLYSTTSDTNVEDSGIGIKYYI